MRIRTMGYLTAEAVSSVRDNGLLSVAAVSTVAISLLVLALIALLALNLQHLAAAVDAQVQVVAYLGPSATPGAAAASAGSASAPSTAASAGAGSTTPAAGAGAAAQHQGAGSSAPSAGTPAGSSAPAPASGAASAPQPEGLILQEIRALPGVTGVTLVPKAQALQNLQQSLGQDGNLVGEFEQNNPLPDSVNIFVSDPRNVAAVAAAVARIDGVSSVANAQATVNKLVSFTQAVRILGIFLVAALALATVVVIGNTVRVAVWARRDQIGVMKLVGATDAFIRWPFFLEGAILGLGGAMISGAIVGFGYNWLHGVVSTSLAFLPLLRPGALLPGLLEALLLGGVLLGALGSAISVRRHLDV